MKLLPQTWQSFKFTIGLAIIFSAMLYGIMVTILILVFGEKACNNNLVWNFLNTIISTCLGWYLAKASTVIDYVWGASVKQLNIPPPSIKGELPYAGEPYEPNVRNLPVPVDVVVNSGGLHQCSKCGTVFHANDKFCSNCGMENLDDQQTNLRHNFQDLGVTGQPRKTPGEGKAESNPVG